MGAERERGDSAKARVLKRANPTWTAAMIARALGCSRELVVQALKHGDQRGRPRRSEDDLRAEVARLRAALSYLPLQANASAQARALKAASPELREHEIAKRLGIARQTVHQALRSSPKRGRPTKVTLAALIARPVSGGRTTT